MRMVGILASKIENVLEVSKRFDKRSKELALEPESAFENDPVFFEMEEAEKDLIFTIKQMASDEYE